MSEETKEITIKTISSIDLSDGDVEDDLLMKKCPKCEDGIVTMGLVHTVIIPEGTLSSRTSGDIKLNHFICDKCSYVELTNYFHE